MQKVKGIPPLGKELPMGKVITVWGSPGSGKSMFSCILAKALTRDKRKAIIINAEISVPMLPVWLPEQIIQTNASVGQYDCRLSRPSDS